MTEKAYIVVNKKQELDMLNKFEQRGLVWRSGRRALNFVPSESVPFNQLNSFPYAFIENVVITWSPMEELKDKTIVYDGRKGDEEVDTRYKVTQEFMNELNEWRQTNFNDDFMFLNGDAIADFSDVINNWWYSSLNDRERNNRLIAIIQWLNGEDVFEVEKPHKFVVRSDNNDHDGNYTYILVENGMTTTAYILDSATKFDTREEAQEWANSHQVVVEIDEEGNEVE